MLKSHEKFHSVNGKRLILVVDDEIINRQLLGAILSENFNILYASDGRKALDIMREYSGVLSLVLLDIMMPVVSGFELLAAAKEDSRLSKIPIIVLTSDKSAEVRSLRLGASDFIPKPYDLPEVILARVQRTIELSEDTYIIQTTEHEELTGLYRQEFFYRYADQLDRHNPLMEMDAIVVEINHLHLITELHGRACSDEIIRSLSRTIQTYCRAVGGLTCRREADTFLIYVPHSDDPEALLDKLYQTVERFETGARLRLRMGIYPRADKSIDIETRFDHAKLACDTLHNNFTKNIAFYDNSLHERELFAEQLLNEMDRAISERQFFVAYQPKYFIQCENPYPASAEALVRWRHPTLGLISPGEFIPLFEQNGLIMRLDRYVWREAAAQIRRWREKFGVTMPVSVNVSRVDMYDPGFKNSIMQIVEENGLRPEDLLLEITESAYTEDSDQIIRLVSELRASGFKVEMDDFGSGYSSLNMLTRLPLDVLKLDMQFIRNLDGNIRDTKMLQLMVDIAKFLEVPVIAEGVEKREQVEILRELGCDYIQGYYFSRPVSPEDFEAFIKERTKNADY